MDVPSSCLSFGAGGGRNRRGEKRGARPPKCDKCAVGQGRCLLFSIDDDENGELRAALQVSATRRAAFPRRGNAHSAFLKRLRTTGKHKFSKLGRNKAGWNQPLSIASDGERKKGVASLCSLASRSHVSLSLSPSLSRCFLSLHPSKKQKKTYSARPHPRRRRPRAHLQGPRQPQPAPREGEGRRGRLHQRRGLQGLAARGRTGGGLHAAARGSAAGRRRRARRRGHAQLWRPGLCRGVLCVGGQGVGVCRGKGQRRRGGGAAVCPEASERLGRRQGGVRGSRARRGRVGQGRRRRGQPAGAVGGRVGGGNEKK